MMTEADEDPTEGAVNLVNMHQSLRPRLVELTHDAARLRLQLEEREASPNKSFRLTPFQLLVPIQPIP